MTEPSIELNALANHVREHLIPLLEDALDAAALRHQIAEGRGVDGFSFGTDAWSMPARQFRNHIEANKIPFEISAEAGCVLVCGQYRVRHHKVGDSEHDSIWLSFPDNAKAASAEARKQMLFNFPELLSMGSAREPIGSGTIVLAYMANPVDGLCAAYLTVVGNVENGKITSWSDAVELWRRDLISPIKSTAKAPPPPPENSDNPVVRRVNRRVKKDDAQE